MWCSFLCSTLTPSSGQGYNESAHNLKNIEVVEVIPKSLNFDVDKQEFIQPVLQGVPVSLDISRFGPNAKYDCVDWHWHNAFQYSVVTEGTVDFYLSGRRFSVKAGDGIFTNYRHLHFMKGHDEEEVSEYLCIDVPPTFIIPDEHSREFQRYMKPVLDKPEPGTLLLSSDVLEEHEIIEKVIEISSLLQSNEEMAGLAVRVKAMEIWMRTWPMIKKDAANLDSSTLDDDDRLREIVLYLENHYSEKILLEDIASHILLSRSECCRFFKKQTGQSLFEYLNVFRLNKSIDLLCGTNMSIADIAAAVGFCSQSYYTTCFKKAKHMTPREYKELSVMPRNELIKTGI